MIGTGIRSVGALVIIAMLAMQPAPAADSDDATIRRQALEFARAFAAGDAKTIAEQWLNDGTFIDESGQVHKGRAEIEQTYGKLFARHGTAPLEINVESLTFPSPTVAVEIGTTSLPSKNSSSRYTAVYVKQDAGWKMSTVTETPDTRKGTDAGKPLAISDLGWLIGSWTGQGTKGLIHMKANWDTNHHFIYCTFGNDNSIDSSQVIGFDLGQDCLCSWHFHSNGCIGHSRWQRKGPDWIANTVSIEADGHRSSAVTVLHPIDANTYTWQSIDRTDDGHPLPDSTVVRVTRNI
jgi:uncharacterized protein (TIGR02246 family)